MAAAIQTLRRPQPRRQPWPPDDTEESVIGTDFHQMTIMNLRWGINEAAHTLVTPGQTVPWHALSQTEIRGFRHPDGSPYTTLPDIFVYRQPLDPNRGSLAISADGPPLLIVEVLSATTYEWDLDIELGKGYSYAAAGVQEYLALDPHGDFAPERVRAWRLVSGVYRPWQANEQGRWESQVLDLAIAVDGEFGTVYAGDGRRMLREGEIEEERARMQAELTRQAEELARLRRRLQERDSDG